MPHQIDSLDFGFALSFEKKNEIKVKNLCARSMKKKKKKKKKKY